MKYEPNRTSNDTLNEIANQAKTVLEKGNLRHVIIRDANGKQIVDFTMTIAVALVVVALLFQPLGTFALVGAIIYGMVKKVRVEVVSSIKDSDDVIEINKDE